MKQLWARRRLDDSVLVEGSAERQEMLERAARGEEHLRDVLRLDPSLAVRGFADSSFSAADAAAVKRAVGEARRRGRIESGRRRSSRWSGVAASVVFIVGLGLLVALLPERKATPRDEAPPQSAAPMGLTHSDVEPFGLPAARIYELAEEDFSVVLVVDESFEL